MAEYELNYFKELYKKYGAHYFKGYFGFTTTEIARKVGINITVFSDVLRGRVPMPEKHKERFIEVFKEMKIEEKTKNFAPDQGQITTRKLTKNLLDMTKICCIITITMMNATANLTAKSNSIFFNDLNTKWREYIFSRRENDLNFSRATKRLLQFFAVAVFIFLSFNSKKISHFLKSHFFAEVGFSFER